MRDAEIAALQRRTRNFRLLRLGALVLVVGYFFLPYGVKLWIPLWLPFSAAVWLELQFFVGGYMHARRGLPPGPRDRGPQPRDLEELGGDDWRETLAYYAEGEHHLVPTEGVEEEDVPQRIAEYLDDPEAFAPAPPLRASRPPLARYAAEVVVALAVFGGLLYVASRPRGWDAVSPAHRAALEARISHEATLIAGHPAVVRCDTSGTRVGAVQEADGVAEVGGTRAFLTPSICNTLYQLAFKHRVQSFNGTARAIAVLGHESTHLNGVANEGLANCFGFQHGVQIGMDFGLSESKARALMREQLATNPADSETTPAYRVPGGCRDGGRYDLHPAVKGFP